MYGGRSNTSPDPLSASSRSSSYSSIVSATGSGPLGSPTAGHTSPAGAVARGHPSMVGDAGRFPHGFPPYSEPALAGLPSAKTGIPRPNGWTGINGPAANNAM